MTGTERKVFQKYYPPDFDPNKLTKAKGKKGGSRQFVQRVMAPFNMQCNTCREYIYKGKKFNMRRETAEGEDYLGLKIFRFYFRCPNCLAELVFKTDMQNVDYQMEHGATRLFEAAKYYQEKQREAEAKEEQEKNDPMKLLEKRTQMSKEEMEAMSKLEELQESNRRNNKLDPLSFLDHKDEDMRLTQAERLKKQEKEDEDEIKKLIAQKNLKITETIEEMEEIDDDKPQSSRSFKPQWKPNKPAKETSVLSGFIKKKSNPFVKLKSPISMVDVKCTPGPSTNVSKPPAISLLGLDYGSDSNEE